jgi:hypothetical protein
LTVPPLTTAASAFRSAWALSPLKSVTVAIDLGETRWRLRGQDQQLVEPAPGMALAAPATTGGASSSARRHSRQAETRQTTRFLPEACVPSFLPSVTAP